MITLDYILEAVRLALALMRLLALAIMCGRQCLFSLCWMYD